MLGIVPIAPVFLAAGVLVTAALIGGRAGAGATVIVGLLAALLLPGTVVPRTGCDVTARGLGDSIVVMSHNALVGNRETSTLVNQFEHVNPDVLLLQETTGELFDEIYPALSQRYPHVISLGLQHIVSRWELSEPFEYGTSTGGVLAASVDSPLGSIRIANVHPSAPVSMERRSNQREEYAQMQTWRVEESVDVLMGDFNAGLAHAIYRDIVSDGYLDAHRSSGCGTGLTWSPGTGLPAVLSLDHALVQERLVAESFEVLDSAGSDHKAIAVRLAIAE